MQRLQSPGAPPKKEKKSGLSCALCNLIVRGLFQSFQQGLSDDEIVENIVTTCSKLALYSPKVCRGTASAAMVFIDNFCFCDVVIPKFALATDFQPTLRYILNSTTVEPGNVCGIVLQSNKCAFSKPDQLEWTIKPSSISKPVKSPVATLSQPPVY